MGFRSDINGLRAVAVVLVVLYHLGVPGFQGGYVGVDVFFVISGFLMTQVVLAKLGKGTFSTLDFYAARVRRLAPALLALTAVLLVAGFFLLLPGAYRDLCKSILTSITFTSNIGFWRERGYFDGPSQLKWLLHTWSLSVEWQFYLVYPLFLRGLATPRAGRFLQVGLVATLLASLALSVVATPLKPEASFFLLPTRMWELLVGGVLYLWQRERPSSTPALAYVGLALIAVAALRYTETLPFPGFYAIVPVLGSALVIAGRGDSPVLANPLAQLLGNTSYSYYLWHWPFIVGARVLELTFTPLVMAALAVLSFVAAFLSHRFVEVPFRTKGAGLVGSQYLWRALAATAVLGVGAGIVYQMRGVPSRVPALVASNDAVASDFVWSDVCGERTVCGVGPATPNKVLFWGDSHIEQLLPAAQALVDDGRNHGKQPLFHAQSACLPVRGIGNPGDHGKCVAFNGATYDRARADDIDTIVIGSIWTPYFRKVLYDPSTRPTVCRAEDDDCVAFETLDEALVVVRAQMLRDVGALRTLGKRVFIVAPVPIFDRHVAVHMADRAWAGVAVELSLPRVRHEALVAPLAAMLREVSDVTGATLLDPASVLCLPGTCVYQQHGVAIYRDNSHLAAAGAVLLAPALEDVFR